MLAGKTRSKEMAETMIKAKNHNTIEIKNALN